MKFYRELMDDDPHRRNERESPKCADDGDLFMPRPGPRRLRLLLDTGSLEGSIDEETAKIFGELLRSEHLDVLVVDMETLTGAPTPDFKSPGVVHVCDTTATMGAFAYPGPGYGWSIYDEDGDLQRAGSFSPGVQLTQAEIARQQAGESDDALTSDEVKRAVLISEVARAVGSDIVVSETRVNGRNDVYAHHRANVVDRVDAVPLIAHFLRIQHRYVIGYRRSINRTGFYQEAVCALAPRLWHWLAKCERAAHFMPESTVYVAECRAIIGRLLRALKARDELIFYLGAHQTRDVMDDAADCIDRVLVSLCGAVDVAARSMHKALQVAGKDFNAKFHKDGWYTNKFRPTYESADGIDELDAKQKLLPVVFELRNTIHSLALEAIGSIGPTDLFFKQDRGRLNVLIPERSAQVMRDTDGDLQQWGARELGPVVIADVAELVQAAIDAVFGFLDSMTAIVSFEQIWDKDKVLQENIISAQSPFGPSGTKAIRMLLLAKGAESTTTPDVATETAT